MIYRNARIFCRDFCFRTGSFEVEDGSFGRIWVGEHCPNTSEKSVDLAGATVIPGLIEIHSHGNSGADFSDGDYTGLKKMARYYAERGITSFAPTSMTLPYEVLSRAFETAKRLQEEKAEGLAQVQGIHMEGPYFSYKKRGAQNPEYLKDPDIQGFMELYRNCGGLISIVDVAPELPGASDFAEEISKICRVSAAHTDTGYEDAVSFYEAGATHLTHMFNGMPGIHHRNPGVIPAAAERPGVTAEILCDGYHVHPAVVRTAFSLFGADRMVIISDSGRCAGLEEGSFFMLGGQQAVLKDGVGQLLDGTIACSAANLWDCMANVMRWGIPEEDAVRAATYNPARVLNKADLIGAIDTGLQADFVITDDRYEKRKVYISGKKV